MDAISDYVKIVTTLLGIAYPILFQVVARLDEKYSSNLIVELFDKEKAKIFFKAFLISSLVSFLLWSLKLPSFINCKELNYLINNSAAILVIINTCLLVISFFFFVSKILIYYTPSKFINYLIRNHDRNDTNLTHFKALSDVFLHSIKKQNTSNSTRISRFFYDAFKAERDSSKGKPVIYPDCYYSLVYNAIEELAIFKNQRNLGLEYRTSGGIWLLGELQDSEISEITYAWLWRNILLAIKYEKDDMVTYHWEHCHQYFWTNFGLIYPEHDENFKITNQEVLDKTAAQKATFLEFHYALGALLLYSKRYSCLNKIFTYTTSEPPKYDLLPENMQMVFDRFYYFRDPFDYKYPWISTKFPFPDLIGINSGNSIKKWICSYMALLFLRQYTIIPYLIIMRPLDFPSLPTSQSEKRSWIDGIGFFKKLVSECLSNNELIKAVNFEFITEQWCLENHKPYPLDFIDQLKGKLEEEYEVGEMNTPLGGDKIQQFYNSSASILNNTINAYSEIIKKEELTADYNKWFINGQRMIQGRDAFTENPEGHHFDFDSILASLLSENIRFGIFSTFRMSFTKSYVLKPEDIFSAIDKFNIDNDFLIINFGINLDRYITFHKINYLNKNDYRAVKIINLPLTRAIRNSIFIIRKKDLPNILSLNIQPEIIEKYSLVKISSDFNIYASVIDLNTTTEEIRTENSQDHTDEEIRKSVLLNIFQSLEVRWKKNIELIELIEYSEYREMGLANELGDIE